MRDGEPAVSNKPTQRKPRLVAEAHGAHDRRPRPPTSTASTRSRRYLTPRCSFAMSVLPARSAMLSNEQRRASAADVCTRAGRLHCCWTATRASSAGNPAAEVKYK